MSSVCFRHLIARIHGPDAPTIAVSNPPECSATNRANVGALRRHPKSSRPARFTGTHTGNFRSLPPTNREVRFGGIEINRMVDGKFAEHWFQLDAVTLFQQIGLLVVPGPRLIPRLVGRPIKTLLGNSR
jgi:hypothetical protein